MKIHYSTRDVLFLGAAAVLVSKPEHAMAQEYRPCVYNHFGVIVNGDSGLNTDWFYVGDKQGAIKFTGGETEDPGYCSTYACWGEDFSFTVPGFIEKNDLALTQTLELMVYRADNTDGPNLDEFTQFQVVCPHATQEISVEVPDSCTDVPVFTSGPFADMDGDSAVCDEGVPHTFKFTCEFDARRMREETTGTDTTSADLAALQDMLPKEHQRRRGLFNQDLVGLLTPCAHLYTPNNLFMVGRNGATFGVWHGPKDGAIDVLAISVDSEAGCNKAACGGQETIHTVPGRTDIEDIGNLGTRKLTINAAFAFPGFIEEDVITVACPKKTQTMSIERDSFDNSDGGCDEADFDEVIDADGPVGAISFECNGLNDGTTVVYEVTCEEESVF